MEADRPTTIDGMADEAETRLRARVDAKGTGWSLEIDPEAGGGCLVQIRSDGIVVRHWFDSRRLDAVNKALNELAHSPL